MLELRGAADAAHAAEETSGARLSAAQDQELHFQGSTECYSTHKGGKEDVMISMHVKLRGAVGIETYIHTCMHACMHTYIHTYIHTYVHAYIRTYIHTYIHTCIHTYLQNCMHACMHACIHTYTV